MTTICKSNKLHHTKNQRRKYNLQIDLGRPKVPIHKTRKSKSLEKLEDWIDAS